MTDDWKWSVISVALLWLPGLLVAALFFMHIMRPAREGKCSWINFALILAILLFYPFLLPLTAFFDFFKVFSENDVFDDFRMLMRVSRAGLQSPMQLVCQIVFVTCGISKIGSLENHSIQITDWQENVISFNVVLPASLILSSLSLIKSLVYVNFQSLFNNEYGNIKVQDKYKGEKDRYINDSSFTLG